MSSEPAITVELPSDQAEDLISTKWDETHNNPQADVILVSNDSVHFRLHSWELKKKR
jgi:hypothetical protein